jgi:serine/threonine-protein kinase
MVPETSGHPLNGLKTLIDTTTILRPAPSIFTGCNDLIAGRYRLIQPLGEGGMGNVYLAEDQRLARQVAVKTIRPALSSNAEVRARIELECRLHAAIGVHPNIVTLHDTVEENGRLYLVMEYFVGETLAGGLAATYRSPGYPLQLTLDIISQILGALSCIHGRDMVHRDIKTANILLQPRADGRYLVKLTDFGIALIDTESEAMHRLTSLGTQGPGTPIYMAPERIDPQTFGAICPATDLYAVGIILYELLTGEPPFKGSMTEVFTGHLMQPPALQKLSPALPAGIHTVLHRALAKKPGDRYQDAQAFLDDLKTLEAGLTSLPSPSTVIQATLLATTHEEAAASASFESTMLNPAVGRDRSLPPSKRKWLYIVAVLVMVLVFAGYLLRAHWLKVLGTPQSPSEYAPTATVPAKAAPMSDLSPVGREAEKKPSALQTVETLRQENKADSKTTGSETGASEPQEWQVIETHSRKIR